MTGLVLLLRKSVAVNLGYVLNEGIMTGGVKKEIGDALRSGNLDNVIVALEKQQSDVIPVDNIGFEYRNLTDSEEQFLKWVASEGQQFNNQNGFLKLVDNQ